MHAPFRTKEIAVNTQTIYTYLSVLDAAIDLKLSKHSPDGSLEYETSGDIADLVLNESADSPAVRFHCRALSSVELGTLVLGLPEREDSSIRLVRECFKLGVVGINGMRIPKYDKQGNAELDEKGDPVYEPLVFQRRMVRGESDRMSDETYRAFDNCDAVRREIGQRILALSTAGFEHRGNSSARMPKKTLGVEGQHARSVDGSPTERIVSDVATPHGGWTTTSNGSGTMEVEQ